MSSVGFTLDMNQTATVSVSLWCCTNRLICFLLGDVFIQPTQDERNPVIYAVFSIAG